MKRAGLTALVAILAISVLGAGGCCKKEKQEIAALQSQYNDLSATNQDLRSKLAQAKAHQMDLESQVAAAATKDAELQRKDQEIAALQAKAKAQAALPAPAQGGQWDVGKHADRISVGSDLLFASGRATLTAAGKAALSRIVADLKGAYAGLPVRVYGYTDSDPIKRTKKLWRDNLDLSANRAMAVTRYLIAKGISPEKVETVAMGSTHFVAKNAARAGKAKNRRVEIVVIKN